MNTPKKRKAFGLVPAMVFTTVGAFLIGGVVTLSSFEFRRQHSRATWERAYQVAENGVMEAVQRISEAPRNADVPELFKVYGAEDMPFALDSDVNQFAFTIKADPSGEPDFYQVKCTATVGDRTRTVVASVQYRPSSKMFDYTYFLDNWGWFWGSSITANGDVRSNWNFDFKSNPTMNGHVYANGNIQNNGVNVDPLAGNVPFYGWAKNNPTVYAHQGVRRLKMPSLQDMSYYKEIAQGTIIQLKKNSTDKGNMLVNKTMTDGIYLIGTTDNPIKIDGTVVVDGDVVLKGVITGTGTLYVGGNLYVAGNVTYANSPTFSLPPTSATTIADRWAYYDNWVDQAFADKKDLVGFGVNGQILMGQVNTSTWQSNCYNNTSYGLKYIGSEDKLGSDGIRGTADDGIPYLDTTGDGVLNYAGYDADGDGTIRTTNYSYTNELQMNATRIKNIKFYPKANSGGGNKINEDYSAWCSWDADGNPLIPENWKDMAVTGTTYADFNNVSASNISLLQGIFFTNHAMAMHSSAAFSLNGTMVCRDEAMIFSGSLKDWYDWRVHSRYVAKYFDGDGNKIIDLNLPQAQKAAIIIRNEEAPQWPLTL